MDWAGARQLRPDTLEVLQHAVARQDHGQRDGALDARDVDGRAIIADG
jgi:hypothetical protein